MSWGILGLWWEAADRTKILGLCIAEMLKATGEELSREDNWQRLFSVVVWSEQTGGELHSQPPFRQVWSLDPGNYHGLKLTDQAMKLL